MNTFFVNRDCCIVTRAVDFFFHDAQLMQFLPSTDIVTHCPVGPLQPHRANKQDVFRFIPRLPRVVFQLLQLLVIF